jgi:hypothetical protein
MHSKDKKNDKIVCKDVMNFICENFDCNKDPKLYKEISQHLENCTDCNKYLSSIKSMVEYYRKYNAELPEEAHDRLLDILGLK